MIGCEAGLAPVALLDAGCAFASLSVCASGARMPFFLIREILPRLLKFIRDATGLGVYAKNDAFTQYFSGILKMLAPVFFNSVWPFSAEKTKTRLFTGVCKIIASFANNGEGFQKYWSQYEFG